MTISPHTPKTVAIIGAGPAGLMAAEQLLHTGIQVDVYDAMPTAARKFLMAGKGGLNITHAEDFAQFVTRYGDRQAEVEAWLRRFGPTELRAWVHGLGVETFVGSSGRVFPAEMKAAPLLRAWLHRLREGGVRFHMRHAWQGFDRRDGDYELLFDGTDGAKSIQADAVILALGGGSWPQLGSDGAWVKILGGRGIHIEPLRPANCGFEVNWSEYLREHFAGAAVKPVVATVEANGRCISLPGEFNITEYGLEGGLIYALSARLRDAIEHAGPATLWLDLLPRYSLDEIKTALDKPHQKLSKANLLRKRLGISGVKAALLREHLDKEGLDDMDTLARTLKSLPIEVQRTRPLSEAISSAGGVSFSELDEDLMLHKWPGLFCTGEMLDWEAPTGGYLLTACFASGVVAGKGVRNWLLRGES